MPVRIMTTRLLRVLGNRGILKLGSFRNFLYGRFGRRFYSLRGPGVTTSLHDVVVLVKDVPDACPLPFAPSRRFKARSNERCASWGTSGIL
jgi:hypothetical protein